MTRTAVQPVPPADLAEAARMLRAVLSAVPPAAGRDRMTARRIEGAAVALEATATVTRTVVGPQIA